MAEHAHAEAGAETTGVPTPLVAMRGASQVQMLQRLQQTAIKKLRDCDGSSPFEVKTALKKHFNSESIRQLANSDPYGMLCFDVRLP